jgi:uncharacterized protein (TIGR02118 family)
LQNATDRTVSVRTPPATTGGLASVQGIAYLSKRSDITTKAFIDYYENHHVPLVLSLASLPTVYKRNYVVRDDAANRESPSIDFDCVTEMVWDDRAGFENWITTLGVDVIATDEANFLDRPQTKAYLIDEHVSAA